VRWLETQGAHLNLHRTPIDVAETFQARLRGYGCNAIYTSATLAVAGDFSHFAGQLGLSDAVARDWPGPFDYRHQALLYLPPDMPNPGTSDYTKAVIEAARPVLVASGVLGLGWALLHPTVQAWATDLEAKYAHGEMRDPRAGEIKVGETVNLAAKLEKHAKREQAHAVATAEATQLARDQGWAPSAPCELRPGRAVEGWGAAVDVVVLG
jgi:hypothetical protein